MKKLFTIDIHTHILPKDIPNFNKKFGYGEFIHTLGDYHIYHEHFDAINIQLDREPISLPILFFNKKNIDKYSLNDFTLENYNPHPAIKAVMNV